MQDFKHQIIKRLNLVKIEYGLSGVFFKFLNTTACWNLIISEYAKSAF